MKKFIYFFCYVKNGKMDNTNKDAALNKAKQYYKNNKERLRQQARNKYRNLS